MKATFENTVKILVQAYLNDELAHGTCAACAVGNIVAHSQNTRPLRDPSNKTTGFSFTGLYNGREVKWNRLFMTGRNGVQNWGNPVKEELYSIKAEIRGTGYSIHELAYIELAFESAPGCPGEGGDLRQTDEWMFNGLMAVVEVLATIHNVDLSVKESAKSLFVK